MNFSPIVVKIPQLDRFGYSDLINLGIAGIAIFALIGSFLISKRQNTLAIRQINREERLKVYAPMLALFRARWVEFDISSRKQTSVTKRAYTLRDEEGLKALEVLVENYEFRARYDLLASNEIKTAVNAWVQNYSDALDLSNDVEFEDALLYQGGKDEETNVASQREGSKRELRKRIEDLMLELDKLQESILSDLEVSDSSKAKNFGGRNRGTRERKRMKNGRN